MLHYDYKIPKSGEWDSSKLLITPNELSARLEDYNGARAQSLANSLGVLVLAYDRPHSLMSRHYALASRPHVTNDSEIILGNTAEKLHTIAEVTHSDEIYIAGHSAAAVEAIGITATGEVKVDFCVATDPAAMRDSMIIKGEVFEFGKYRLSTELLNKKTASVDTSSNTPPDVKPDNKEMSRRGRDEILAYSAYWRSTATLESLARIAVFRPYTNLAVEFAEHTFVGDYKYLVGVAKDLNMIRPDSPDNGSFRVIVRKGKYHGEWDSFGNFEDTVANHTDLEVQAA